MGLYVTGTIGSKHTSHCRLAILYVSTTIGSMLHAVPASSANLCATQVAHGLYYATSNGVDRHVFQAVLKGQWVALQVAQTHTQIPSLLPRPLSLMACGPGTI